MLTVSSWNLSETRWKRVQWLELNVFPSAWVASSFWTHKKQNPNNDIQNTKIQNIIKLIPYMVISRVAWLFCFQYNPGLFALPVFRLPVNEPCTAEKVHHFKIPSSWPSECRAAKQKQLLAKGKLNIYQIQIWRHSRSFLCRKSLQRFQTFKISELKFTGFIADSSTVGRINNGGRVKNETK